MKNKDKTIKFIKFTRGRWVSCSMRSSTLHER